MLAAMSRASFLLSSLAADRRSIPVRDRVVTNTAFAELSPALWRQIANVSEQAGFCARLVWNFGGAKTEGVTRAGHVGAGDGSPKVELSTTLIQRRSQ